MAYSRRNLQFDLYAQLSYMSAIATAGVSRSQLFRYGAELPYASSQYFRDINTLAEKMNTDYAQACRVVAEEAKSPEVKSLLIRMAGSLSSGEAEADFLRREAELLGESYGNQYQRDVESLKMWTDAYVTLLVAAGLIVVVAIISMMIYQVGVTIIGAMALTMVLATCIGAWIIYASAPREAKTRITGPSSRLQLLGTRLFKITMPLAVAFCTLMTLKGIGLGWVLIIGAVIIFPAGFLINKDEKNITRKDSDIPTVVRVLGGVTSALGTTLTQALNKVDRRSMGALMPEITRLRRRLQAGVDPSLCWNTLVAETGSELIDRTVRMFYRPLSLGGEPAKIASLASSFASRMTFLRATRAMTASTFRGLTIPLHGAMVGLLQFIVEIMTLFTTSINATSESLAASAGGSGTLLAGPIVTFGQVNMQLVQTLVTFVVLVLTGTNAFAPKAADGGHGLKFIHNLSITAAISGLMLLAVPVVARGIFKSVIEN